LTTSTISNNSFYIILYCPHSSSHQSSNCSNNSLNTSARYTLFPEWICSSNLEDTCCNQGSRMNLRRNRGRLVCMLWNITQNNIQTMDYILHLQDKNCKCFRV
jgi:hypothetical protein